MDSGARFRQIVDKAVAASSFFSSLDISQSPIQIKETDKGQTLSDLASQNVILVCSGAFEVFSCAEDGKEVLLATLLPGDVFGINSLYLSDMDVESSIRCRKKGVLLSMSNEECRRLLESSPSAMVDYARLCNEKIHFLLQRIRELTVQNSRDRLLCYLRSHAGCDGTVKLGKSREAVAKMLNMSRAALFSQLAVLQEENLIENKDGEIRIV